MRNGHLKKKYLVLACTMDLVRKLAICVILGLTTAFFSSFAH